MPTTQFLRKADPTFKKMSEKCFKVTKEAIKSDLKMLFKLLTDGEIVMSLTIISFVDALWTFSNQLLKYLRGKVEMLTIFWPLQ